jgi:uncharacterized RDD family membrane protein YckC
MDIMPSNLPGPDDPLGVFADKLTIETPEQTGLDFAVAGIGSRFLALAFDTMIQMGVALVAGLGGGMLIRSLAAVYPVATTWAAGLLILFFFLLYFGYFALFEILWNGQTPGKRKAGIRVIKDSGRPLTAAESIGRNLMRIVDWLPALYAIGIASAILNKENKRLGDLIVGSLVVRESSFGDLKPAWQTARDPGVPAFSFLAGGHLSAEEYALIESFLNRRLDLEPTIRYRMADEILRRLQSKLTLPAGNTLSAERILEALTYEHRAAGRYS